MAEVTCGLSNDLASLVMAYETKDELVCCCTLLLLNPSTETEVSKKSFENCYALSAGKQTELRRKVPNHLNIL